MLTADALIDDQPDDFLAGLPADLVASTAARAAGAGLSRADYLRRAINRDSPAVAAARAGTPRSVVSELFADLDEDELVPSVLR